MAKEAMLMVLWEPPAALMEEFNAWYDTEHLPERAVIDGFRTARRYVSTGDGPPHMAAYDLTSLDVLETPAYQAVAGENFSPWSRRIMARAGPQRLAGTLHSGTPEATVDCARLLVLKFTIGAASDVDRVAAALPAVLDGKPELKRWRLFSGVLPEPDFAFVVAEFSGNSVPEIDAASVGFPMTLAASYRPYRY
jgi:hypothetical protein